MLVSAYLPIIFTILPVDTGRKLSVHKTFRRRPGRLLNVLCTFNLRPVSTGLVYHLSVVSTRLRVASARFYSFTSRFYSFITRFTFKYLRKNHMQLPT